MGNISQRKLINNEFKLEYNWLNYVREAIEPIDINITQILKEISENLQHDLLKAATLEDLNIEITPIGSIELNTHVKSEDTVDLIMGLKDNCKTENPNINSNHTLLQEIFRLKDFTIRYLKNKFPEALLDDSQPLALHLSIPIFPCNFCLYFGFTQTVMENTSGNFSDIENGGLFNFKTFSFTTINPLKYAHNLNTRNEKTQGNTKTLIRLLKSLKADSIEPVTLTGHQLTCIIYSMDEYALSKTPGQILFLILEVSLYLKKLYDNPFIRKSIKSPDRSTLQILDNDNSLLHGIFILKKELDSLIKNLVLEIDLYTDIYKPVAI